MNNTYTISSVAYIKAESREQARKALEELFQTTYKEQDKDCLVNWEVFYGGWRDE